MFETERLDTGTVVWYNVPTTTRNRRHNMKKQFCFFVALLLALMSLNGCSLLVNRVDPGRLEAVTEGKTADPHADGSDREVNITMTEIVHANSTAKLRENYGSFQITYTYSDGYVWVYYVDQNMISEMDEDYCAVYTETDCMYCDGGYYGRVLYAGVEPNTEWSRWLILNEYNTLWETVERAVLREGKIYVNTILHAEYIEDVHGDEEGLSSVVLSYVLDAETYAILESETTYRYIDGYCETVKSRLEINAETPSEMSSLMAHMTTPTDTRTFTVVLDPNTPEEVAYSVTVPKDDFVEFYYPETYSEVYLDRACTQLATEEDLTTDRDLTVYVKNLNIEAETAGSL